CDAPLAAAGADGDREDHSVIFALVQSREQMRDLRFGRVMVKQKAFGLRGARYQLVDENLRDLMIILVGESYVQQAPPRIERQPAPFIADQRDRTVGDLLRDLVEPRI